VVEDEPDDFFIAKGLPEPDDSQHVRELLDRMDVADEGLACLLPDVGYLSFEESCWLVFDLLQGPSIMLLAPPLRFIIKTDLQILQCSKVR